jgi:hypothetical protein
MENARIRAGGSFRIRAGDEVYGATNEQFSRAYEECAMPFARMMAHKPTTLNFMEAASAPKPR